MGVHKFHEDDLFLIRLRDRDIAEFQPARGTGMMDATAFKAEKGEAYTLTIDGKVICIAGLFEMWPGVAEVWTLMSDEAHRYGIAITRFIKKLIAEHTGDYHRVQCTVAEDYEISHKWLNVLGFEREGLLRKFARTGDSYYMYARVK